MNKIFLCVFLVLFSIFGALVKWLNANRQAPSTFIVLGIEAITAAYIGMMIYALYEWLQCHEGLAFALAGLAGYFGTKSIDVIQKYIIRYFNLDKE